MSDDKMMTPQPTITASELRSLILYDQGTGIFTWLDRPHQRGWGSRLTGVRAGRITAKGYRFIGINSRYYKAHRLAWLYVHGEWPPHEVDHIDGNRDNNAIANLRLATRSQNAANRRKRAGGTSAFKGVHWHAATGKWAAATKLNGRSKHIGLFDTEQEAANAYALHAKQAHGEFTRLG